MVQRLPPLLGSLILIGIGCWRVWFQSRRYGTRGVVLFRSRNFAENLRDGLAVALFALLVAQAIVWVFSPETLRPWGAGHSTRAIREALGAVVLIGGLAFLVGARVGLGASWGLCVRGGAGAWPVATGLCRFLCT